MNSRGSTHTKVQIILALTEDPDGRRRRSDFVVTEKRYGKKVKDLRFLSEKVLLRYYDSPNPLPTEKGVGIIEKSLSELRAHKLIERKTIYGDGGRYKWYKLKCNSLYELARIFNFIYDSETVSDDYYNGYERLKRFVTSRFFYRAMSLYIFDLIYYFDLWDAEKYPLSRDCCRMLVSKEKRSKHIPKDSTILFFNPFSGPDFPRFFRRYFPKEGPALYESYLRESKLQEQYLRDLGLVSTRETAYVMDPEIFDEVLNFFRFLRKLLQISPETNEPKVDLLDHWFNKFWYMGLLYYVRGIESMRQENSPVPRGQLTNRICILDQGKILLGKHSFPNAYTIKGIFSRHQILFPEFIINKYPAYYPDNIIYVSVSNRQFIWNRRDKI